MHPSPNHHPFLTWFILFYFKFEKKKRFFFIFLRQKSFSGTVSYMGFHIWAFDNRNGSIWPPLPRKVLFSQKYLSLFTIFQGEIRLPGHPEFFWWGCIPPTLAFENGFDKILLAFWGTDGSFAGICMAAMRINTPLLWGGSLGKELAVGAPPIICPSPKKVH